MLQGPAVAVGIVEEGHGDPPAEVLDLSDVHTSPEATGAGALPNGAAYYSAALSWQTALGGSPAGIVYPNKKKWSGDHGAFDYKQTAGTLISSRAVDVRDARIIDIAPTVLKYFGVPIPTDIDGKPLF